MYLLRLMLVGVWLGLLWVLFYFFDHYIQSSVLVVIYLPSVLVVCVQFNRRMATSACRAACLTGAVARALQ